MLLLLDEKLEPSKYRFFRILGKKNLQYALGGLWNEIRKCFSIPKVVKLTSSLQFFLITKCFLIRLLHKFMALALLVLITSLFPLNFLSSSPKSVFSGSLGCGNLSERRASGLVFCESNTSEYRTICVSSSVLFHLYSVSISGMQCCGLNNNRNPYKRVS